MNHTTSYEDGGLERVFRAILTARHWNGLLQQAFKHFLTEHIRFDSDPDQGHGALCRHLRPDDRVLRLWADFKRMLVEAVPRLGHQRDRRELNSIGKGGRLRAD